MLPSKTFTLNPPSLDELAQVLNDGLKSHYDVHHVSVVECPDLTKEPFNLAASGLGGKTAIADVGSIFNLVPVAQKNKIYSFEQVADLVNIGDKDCFMIGAAAGPFDKVGTNCELVPNVLLKKEKDHFKMASNKTVYVKTKDHHQKLDVSSTSEFTLLGDFFVSEGKPGKVLKIEAQKRIGDEGSFTVNLQQILKQKYGDQPISFGGAFLIEKGKAKCHVMPDFPKEPLKSEEEVYKWFNFFDFEAPLVCLSAVHTVDPDLSLYMEHTHCFSEHNQGGHYHYDATPEIIKYVAYINVAHTIYRIDGLNQNMIK